ncbi:MAG: TatD family hydrolase [Victivallaceae bacterium]|nr:TatD family hydrolase [Victivallaceae bacterium]
MTNSIWGKDHSIAQAYWRTGYADFPIYDLHGHVGAHYAIYMKRCEPDTMACHLRRAGVKHLVFSHHEALFGNMRNEQVYQLCRSQPDLLRMYVAINPHYPERIREDLAKFDAWAPFAVGFKFLADYHNERVDSKAYEPVLKFANERKLPILNHTWGGSCCSNSTILLAVAQKYPGAKFFMGHSFFGDWDGAVKVVRETPGNVWLELTAIPGESGIIERLVQGVGSTRLLFGTDLPWFDEFQAIGGVLSAKIDEEDMRNIFYRNAEQIFGENW